MIELSIYYGGEEMEKECVSRTEFNHLKEKVEAMEKDVQESQK